MKVKQEGSHARFCSRYSLASGICHGSRCRREIISVGLLLLVLAENSLRYHDLTFYALLSSVSYKRSYARSSLTQDITRRCCMRQIGVLTKKATPKEFGFSTGTMTVAIDRCPWLRIISITQDGYPLSHHLPGQPTHDLESGS